MNFWRPTGVFGAGLPERRFGFRMVDHPIC